MAEQRKLTRQEQVAARFKPLLERQPVGEPVEGVQPLNPGYFALERIRTEARPKEHAALRTKMKSSR